MSCRGIEQVREAGRRKIKLFLLENDPEIFSSSLSRESSETNRLSILALWLVNQLWFIVPVSSWKNGASSALLYIYVICRLGGPYSEKLWPKSWKCCPRPQAEGSIFKTEVTVFHYTDRPKPENNLFIFFLSLKRLRLLTGKNSRKRYCDRGQR